MENARKLGLMAVSFFFIVFLAASMEGISKKKPLK
jgi:hypothetical protein